MADLRLGHPHEPHLEGAGHGIHGSTGGHRIVNLAMASPSGAALFEIERDELVAFLQQTYLAVPTGWEADVVDLDLELALLLRDE